MRERPFAVLPDGLVKSVCWPQSVLVFVNRQARRALAIGRDRQLDGSLISKSEFVHERPMKIEPLSQRTAWRTTKKKQQDS
jgi:hypothetical protein